MWFSDDIFNTLTKLSFSLPYSSTMVSIIRIKIWWNDTLLKLLLPLQHLILRHPNPIKYSLISISQPMFGHHILLILRGWLDHHITNLISRMHHYPICLLIPFDRTLHLLCIPPLSPPPHRIPPLPSFPILSFPWLSLNINLWIPIRLHIGIWIGKVKGMVQCIAFGVKDCTIVRQMVFGRQRNLL